MAPDKNQAQPVRNRDYHGFHKGNGKVTLGFSFDIFEGIDGLEAWFYFDLCQRRDCQTEQNEIGPFEDDYMKSEDDLRNPYSFAIHTILSRLLLWFSLI
jgi:hypothetical protein